MAIVRGEIVQETPIDSDLIFTESSIHTTTDVLARALRRVLVDKKITREALSQLHREHMQKMCASSNNINYNWNNLKKAVMRDTITFHMFQFIVVSILNCHIEKIDLTIQDADGSSAVVTLDL